MELQTRPEAEFVILRLTPDTEGINCKCPFYSEECTGLKTEWTSTIQTTTQFPVVYGTVLVLTCSDPDAENKGSSQVTCTSGTSFTYLTEPNCVIPGIL